LERVRVARTSAQNHCPQRKSAIATSDQKRMLKARAREKARVWESPKAARARAKEARDPRDRREVRDPKAREARNPRAKERETWEKEG
jgi:hypothetical protein